MKTPITSAEDLAELWDRTYNYSKIPDWQHLLPAYAEEIYFRDSIQELKGMKEFREMIDRLTSRSRELGMNIVSKVMEDNIIFFEWEMIITYKKRPKSIIYGASRFTLDEQGLIKEQRDYYDLWGDIFDNIPMMHKRYRKFMQKKFG